MRKLAFLFVSLFIGTLLAVPASAHHKNFKVSVYVRAYEVDKMKDSEWLESSWKTISSQLDVDKIYLETHRDMLLVDDATLEKAKKFFQKQGIEVAGGITYTISEPNDFETFSYSDPENRAWVKKVAEHTARHFDEFLLDDFFFTSSKKDVEIRSKGGKAWTEYRLSLMNEAGRNLVVGPAKAVNPKVKVIIKYPNWYDHFQGLGFNLEDGPQIFDGVWTGTETRDPSGAQHLQNYESYNIIRYFESLRPGHNGGGWVDSGGSQMGMDRYAEQLWLTMFAKAPEMALFDYRQLIGVNLNPAVYRTPWQGQGTSFDWDEMMKPYKGVTPTTLARVAGYVFDKIDPIVGQLGNPKGIVSYKAYHTQGDDFLQNYFGMIGLPMDERSEFPTDQQVVLLTEQAKGDPDLVKKIDAQLHRGGDVVVTSGLLEAIPDKLAQFIEMGVEGYTLVDDFGRYGKADREFIIPQIWYYTNDSWEIISAGRPLTKGTSGYPILHRGKYSKGNLYVLTVPEDFSDLYHYPVPALNLIRQTLGRDLKARLEGPALVSLFVYDNDKVIVESFRDEACTAFVVVGDRRIPVVLKPHSCERIGIK
jgi:hypothetical protein